MEGGVSLSEKDRKALVRQFRNGITLEALRALILLLAAQGVTYLVMRSLMAQRREMWHDRLDMSPRKRPPEPARVEETIPLSDSVDRLAGQLRVLLNVLDEIREDFVRCCRFDGQSNSLDWCSQPGDLDASEERQEVGDSSGEGGWLEAPSREANAAGVHGRIPA